MSHGTLRYWIRIFGLADKVESVEMVKKEWEKNQVSEEEVYLLQLRIKELESALKQAELARDAYDCMIEIAESSYHIKVRKNSDAR